jgi:hypothetical protein
MSVNHAPATAEQYAAVLEGDRRAKFTPFTKVKARLGMTVADTLGLPQEFSGVVDIYQDKMPRGEDGMWAMIWVIPEGRQDAVPVLPEDCQESC